MKYNLKTKSPFTLDIKPSNRLGTDEISAEKCFSFKFSSVSNSPPGVLVGAATFGYLGDALGRKNTLVWAYFQTAVMGFGKREDTHSHILTLLKNF